MNFISSRNQTLSVDIKTAILNGLAPDGGLYCPKEFPDLSKIFDSFNDQTSFNTVAKQTFTALFENTLGKESTSRIIDKAFSFSPKITHLEDNLSILELFHGPSHAFKDFGACFLASAMEEFLLNDNKKAVILTATSGDTGSAVAQAFYQRRNINVIILYPSGRVSPLQEKQLTTLGENITALEINGSFDDCQRMVKEAFLDRELSSKIPLTSANSINLGRLIPQSFYYIWARKHFKTDKFVFSVPSGNFGNLTAGLYAHKWGLPVTRYIAATNSNDIVPSYLLTGIFNPRDSIQTLSNAMDVGAPSNFERLSYLFNNDVDLFRDLMIGTTISDQETLSVMKSIAEEYNYYLCPHTAVGYLAAKKYQEKNPKTHISILATAHPAKFLEIVEQATGKRPEIPENLSALLLKEKHSLLLDPDIKELKSFVLNNYQ